MRHSQRERLILQRPFLSSGSTIAVLPSGFDATHALTKQSVGGLDPASTQPWQAISITGRLQHHPLWHWFCCSINSPAISGEEKQRRSQGIRRR